MTSWPTKEPLRASARGGASLSDQADCLLQGDEDRAPATTYIMEGPGETDRLQIKTENVLIRRHLDWVGLLPGESFVDIGCGSGEVVLTAARLCRPGLVTGIDGNPNRLATLLERAAAQGLRQVDGHAATIGRVGSTGLPDGAYDHAWARFFLEYQPCPVEVVGEMARIVRPGGRVTVIDLEGNGVWHYGMDKTLRAGLAEVITDLASTGFDPYIGRRLAAIAHTAGLRDIRHEIEPYHRIVGHPDARTAQAWQRKIHGLATNYLTHLFPHKRHLAWVFDAYHEFLLRDDTMTWSLLHLVQGTVPVMVDHRTPRRLAPVSRQFFGHGRGAGSGGEVSTASSA